MGHETPPALLPQPSPGGGMLHQAGRLPGRGGNRRADLPDRGSRSGVRIPVQGKSGANGTKRSCAPAGRATSTTATCIPWISPYGTGSRRNRKPRNTETAAAVEQFPVAYFSLLCYQVSHESAQAVHAPVCVRGSLFLRGNLSGTGRTEGKKKPFGIHAG